MKEQITHFKIDRSKWRSGDAGEYMTGAGRAELLNSSGYMCCLGQCMSQLGIEDEDLVGRGEPNCVANLLPFSQYSNCTELSFDAMEINDNLVNTIEHREEKLTELFKKHGLSIEFFGEPVTIINK